MRKLAVFLCTTALLAAFAFAPKVSAQIVVNIGVQPVCAYGYYDYAPYACSPRGYYGSGYFYNGIFLGMGPWAGWGYGHGWGGHRFANDGGGSYRGGGGFAANHSNFARSGGSGQHADTGRNNESHAVPSNRGASNAGGQRPNAGRLAPSHNGGGGSPHQSSGHGDAGRDGGGHEGGGGKH